MSERKYVVPEGMLKAACAAQSARRIDPEGWIVVRESLEAAIRWLAENPMVPTKKQAEDVSSIRPIELFQVGLREWQRRMFLAPEPDVPDEIRDLYFGGLHEGSEVTAIIRDRVLEAWRRGKESK